LIEFIPRNLISPIVVIVCVVVYLEYFEEINEDLIGDLPAIYNIRVSLGLKSLLECSVGGDTSILSIVFLECFIYSHLSCLRELTQDGSHKLLNGDRAIIIRVEGLEEGLNVLVF